MALVQRTVSCVLAMGCCHHLQGRSYSEEVAAIVQFQQRSKFRGQADELFMNLTGETKTIRSSTFKKPHTARGANAARGWSASLSNGCAEAHALYKRTNYADLGRNLAENGTEDARESALALMQAG